jgi:hypothetical protein
MTKYAQVLSIELNGGPTVVHVLNFYADLREMEAPLFSFDQRSRFPGQ